MEPITLGILRETKDPPDRRVPLDPGQCRLLKERFSGLEILVQPSPIRCFPDEAYRSAGITLREDLSACQILLGVKEVDPSALIPGKTYLFFSHTAKKQPYNRKLLQTVMRRGIRLIDYEYLTDGKGVRVVAFGRWAGVVGAYNGLRAWGIRTKRYELPPAGSLEDHSRLTEKLKGLDAGSCRIAVTGGGRVAGGALEVLKAAGIREVSPAQYMEEDFSGAVYTRLDPWHYAGTRDGSPFSFDRFAARPEEFENRFVPYSRKTDLYIACHFWDPRAPMLLSREELAATGFPIQVVADISCDIGGPIASTLRASTIAEPFYGYDRRTGRETGPFDEDAVTVMAVDNLPGELPRDASADFGEALTRHVLPELLGETDSGMVERACIAENGTLTERYSYLQGYLDGRE